MIETLKERLDKRNIEVNGAIVRADSVEATLILFSSLVLNFVMGKQTELRFRLGWDPIIDISYVKWVLTDFKVQPFG